MNDLYIFDTINSNWTQIYVNGTIPDGRADHTIVGLWKNKYYVVYGGQGETINYQDTWLLDITNFQWTQLNTLNTPISRYGHTAVLSGNMMLVQGGENNSPSFPELWQLNLITATWTLLQPFGPIPSARSYHGCSLIGDNMYIFGGLDNNGNILSDVWAYSISRNTYVQIVSLDTTLTFSGAYGLRCVPFPSSQVIYCGTGVPIGNNPYTMQVFNTGYHDITVSPVGSDILCQLDEIKPCQDINFALSSFFGSTILESIVSRDLPNQLTLSGINYISNIQMSLPVEIHASGPNVILDCGMESCFILNNIISSPFTLTGLLIRNGYSYNGGAISLTNSWLDMFNVTFINNTAILSGGAIYATSNSKINMIDASFIDNKAVQGGAIYVDKSGIVTESSRFAGNLATESGGALVGIDSTLMLSKSVFQGNAIKTQSNGTNAFIAGGALLLIDSDVKLSQSSFTRNRIQSDISNYGGAIALYTTSLSLDQVTLNQNIAMYGGGIATLSVPTFAANLLTSVLQPSRLILNKTDWNQNQALSGGALYTSDTTQISMSYSTLSNNWAQNEGGAWTAIRSTIITNMTYFTNNICENGNGGAISLADTTGIINHSIFISNQSPKGGGGAIYSSAQSALDIQNNQIDSSNYASFGSAIASDPVSIKLSTGWNGIQSAGSNISPPPLITLRDFHGQIVSNIPTTIKAISIPSTAIKQTGKCSRYAEWHS